MEWTISDDATVHGSGTLPSDIASLVAGLETPHTGFFGPGSTVWMVSRETVLLVSGVSTILLQVAHPLIAAGVADHSGFDEAPISRFRRTFDLVHAIIFGDAETAVEAALEIRALHARITGTLEEDIGSFPAETHYAASDPDLLLWVHATLIEQALTAYNTYVAPLPASDRAEYYQECKVFGQLLGIPAEQYPETLTDFSDYYDRMLETKLTVEIQGRELQRTLFTQGRVFGPLYTALAAGTLPGPVRDEFRLPWTPQRQRLFDAGAAVVRAVVPSLPARLRYVKEYHNARARLQRAENAAHVPSPPADRTE